MNIFQHAEALQNVDVELGLSGCPVGHHPGAALDPALVGGGPYFLPPAHLVPDPKSLHRMEKAHLRFVRMAEAERRLKLTAYGCVVFIAVILILAVALGALIFLRAHPELWMGSITATHHHNRREP